MMRNKGDIHYILSPVRKQMADGYHLTPSPGFVRNNVVAVGNWKLPQCSHPDHSSQDSNDLQLQPPQYLQTTRYQHH
jgi:hypothetical protein